MPHESSPIKSSAVELNEIINNSWDGICIIDKKTNFIYLNDAMSPMLGYQKDELYNKPFLSFVKRDFQAIFLQLLKDNILNSYDTDANIICTRKDQQPIYIKITVSLMMNKKHFVLNAKDITKEISDQEILNNYVLSIHLNTDNVITKVSNAFCKLSGYTYEALINKKFSQLRHKEMKEEVFNASFDALKSAEKTNQKFQLSSVSEDSFYIDTKMKSMHNKYGDTLGYTLLMFDITNELLLDNKLSIENAKLNIMGDTITTISHEWRQPLNIISLKAQNLQFETEDLNSLHVLDEIQDTAKQLSNTIEEFQNIVKIKSAKISVSIEDLINKSIKTFSEKFSSDNSIDNTITFTFNNSITKSVDLYDKELIKILHSLYCNSSDAYERNDIKKKEIDIHTYTKKSILYITLVDKAGGIEESVLPQIYDPYFSTKKLRHGVGLGLYMSQTIIQMHFGGSIHIENQNNGVFIKIKIPLN